MRKPQSRISQLILHLLLKNQMTRVFPPPFDFCSSLEGYCLPPARFFISEGVPADLDNSYLELDSPLIAAIMLEIELRNPGWPL